MLLKPVKNKLDESSIEANLQSILDGINERVEIDRGPERFHDRNVAFPEINHADYFMGTTNFDPTYYPRCHLGERYEDIHLVRRYLYSTPDYDKFFHYLRVKHNAISAEIFKIHWKARAAQAANAWESVRTKVDGLDPRIFYVGVLERLNPRGLQEKCNELMAEVVSEVLLENEALFRVHPMGRQVRILTGNSQALATMPQDNCPNVGRYTEDYDSSHYIGAVDEGMAEASLFTCNVPKFKSRLDKVDLDGTCANTKSMTRSLEDHAHYWTPILNWENLRQPGFLASFMLHRAAHHPALFASRDFESTYIGRAGRMDDTFHWHYLPDFWELKEDDQYAHFIEAPGEGQVWQNSVAKAVAAKGQLYTHLEVGAILHSQQIIYTFLDRLVTYIQEKAKIPPNLDIPMAVSCPNLGEKLPEAELLIDDLLRNDLNKLRENNGSNPIKEATHLWATKQYAPPDDTVFDVDECERILLSLRDDARDKLNKLMTDPEVFLNEAKIIIDHHPGQVKLGEAKLKTRHFETDKVKKLGKAEAERLEDELSACVLQRIVLTAVRDLEIWEHLYTVASRLGDYIRTEHIDLTDYETLLDDELRQLWLLLLHSLRANFRHYYRDFQEWDTFLASPPMRDQAKRSWRALATTKPEGRYSYTEDEIKAGEERSKGPETDETRAYRRKKYTGAERMKKTAETDWAKDLCALYCPKSLIMTRWSVLLEDNFRLDTVQSDADRIQKLMFNALPCGVDLAYVGMSNTVEYLAELDANMEPGDRLITSHVWSHIRKLSVLSHLVDDMERTRRILPPQSQRLRQEFEEEYGDLSKYVFGPARYLPELATDMFLPSKLLSGCKPLKGLLYPLLKSIDMGENAKNANDDPMMVDEGMIGTMIRQIEDVDMDRVENVDDGGLTLYKQGWDKVMTPENRKKDLVILWRQALSGIVGKTLDDVFACSNVKKFNKGLGKMTEMINDGTGKFGLGLARFLSTFETEQMKARTQKELAELAEMRKREEEDEIARLIERIERDSENLERLMREADGETTQGADSTANAQRSTSNAQAASRPPRVRDENSKYRKNMKEQRARQRGRRGQQAIEATGAPPIVRMPLAARHWEAFAGTLGVRYQGAVPRTDFDNFKAAMGAVGYSMKHLDGSVVRFSWTPNSNLPPALAKISFETHEPHGSALQNMRKVMLKIGKRLPGAGVTRKRLVKYYKPAPPGWPDAPVGG